MWLAAGRWFSWETPVSSTNKTDRHDIAEILLTMVPNTIALALKQINDVLILYFRNGVALQSDLIKVDTKKDIVQNQGRLLQKRSDGNIESNDTPLLASLFTICISCDMSWRAWLVIG
jgi:hypothetical protein